MSITGDAFWWLEDSHLNDYFCHFAQTFGKVAETNEWYFVCQCSLVVSTLIGGGGTQTLTAKI